MRPIAWGRWALAAVIVGVAFLADVRRPETERYPFAARALAAGDRVDEGDIAWRRIPAGSLPETDLSGQLRIALGSGTPLVPDLFTPASIVPEGWWIVQVPLGPTATAGTRVRLVVLDPPLAVDGVVAGPAVDDPFAGEPIGPVGIPPAWADLVARAVASGGIVTLIASD